MLHCGLIAASLLAFAACSGTEEKKPAPKKAKAQSYDAAAFVDHLSAAAITLNNGGTVTDIGDDVKAIEGYTAKKGKPVMLNIAVLDYSDHSGRSKHAIAPVDGSKSSVLSALNGASYKLKDVRVLSAIITTTPPIKAGSNKDVLQQVLEARQQSILSGSQKVDPLAEAKLDLKLLRAFTSASQRDAAYISADNAKRILAKIAQDGQNKEATEKLAKELEVAEGELRKTLPY